MNISRRQLVSLAAVLVASASGVAYAVLSGGNWFDVDILYGTNGVSAPAPAVSYSHSLVVDRNDANHGSYSLLSALPKSTSGYQGPYSILRRTTAGAIDTSFGANGLVTSFVNSSDAIYDFRRLCVDPLTHNLVVIAAANSLNATVIERLTPPNASGTAALDVTFNPGGATPGMVSVTGVHDAGGCSVTGDQSIIVAARDNASPINAVLLKLLVNGTPDPSFGTAGIVTVTPPNGENWEGGGIEWNSSQTIINDIIIGGDTYPTGNSSANTAALIALDVCTGVPDRQFNGNGFMSVPVIDTYTFSSPIVGSIDNSGVMWVALIARGTLNVDLVPWTYPVTASKWSVPTAPGTVVPPAGVMFGQGASPARQSDGSILVAGDTSANQDVLFALFGDGSLSFTVSAPAPFTCGATVVPNVVGQTQAAATTAITGAGLTVGTVTQQASSTVPSGTVISESPVAGSHVAAGAAVNLVVSAGPGPVVVPNVVGQTQAAATTAITGAGLTVGTVTQQASSTVASGSVISESPAAGTNVATGSAVNLVVSTGPAQVAVPNVVAQTQAAATAAITGAGLTVGTVTQQSSSTIASGSVISQSPAAGTNVASGSAVNLVVSTGGGGSGGGGGGAFDLFTLGALLSSLLLGLRRAREVAHRRRSAPDA